MSRTVAIVGRPNVGKSRLFNRLARKRISIVHDQPGVTRDIISAPIADGDYMLLDTGGLGLKGGETVRELIAASERQVDFAIEAADVVLLVIDGLEGLTALDEKIAGQLRRTGKSIITVVNKADFGEEKIDIGQVHRLGLGEPIFVSAEHGRGEELLRDEILRRLGPSESGEAPARTAADPLCVCFVGRPNVGKSSLSNRLLASDRLIVSPVPGTTRDAVEIPFEYKGRDGRMHPFRLIDTAGIRRRGKIQGSVEYYMVNRAQKAIDRCDCAMIVIDGEEGLTDGDKRVMKLAHDAGKAVVFAVNKWDTKEPPNGMPKKNSDLKKEFTKIIRNEVPELAYAPIVFTSAKENAGLEPALDQVLSALESYNFRISTGQLNRLIQDAIFDKPHITHGRAFKVYYSTQVATAPPTFVLFCNDPELMHFSYQRYLLNKIRGLFPLMGTPIRIFARSSHKREEEK
jgi:GTP-binding protein